MAASYIPPAPQQSSWWVAASAGSWFSGALIHIWRPEITDGCDIFCLLIWQNTFSFHTHILLSTHIKDFGEGEMIEMTIPKTRLFIMDMTIVIIEIFFI